MKKLCWGAGFLLFAAITLISGFRDALIPSVLSLLLLCILCLTALPFTKVLFPERAASLIFLFPAGYLIHSVMLSIVVFCFGMNRFIVISYLTVFLALFTLFHYRLKGKSPADLSNSRFRWEQIDTLLLLCWILMALATVALPFANVGAETYSGAAYRAYFNADFFRNMAVAGQLANSGVPPDNPYFGGVTLHYYWFFHMIPACWNELFPQFRHDFLMVQFSIAAVCMFVASIFYAVWRFSSSRLTLLLLFPLLTFGGSYEGIFILQHLHSKQLSWHKFTEWNIDGVLRWIWSAPQIDTLYRALLYAPQHLIALCVFLMAVLVWTSQSKHLARIFLCLLIFSTIGMSTFVGGMLVLTGGFLFLWRFVRNPRENWQELIGWVFIGMTFLALYFPLFQMFRPGSERIGFEPDPVILSHFFSFFILNWGAPLILGLAGVFWHSPRIPFRLLLFFLCCCVIAIVFIRLDRPGASDISLKLGHFSHVVLLLLAAGFIDRFLIQYPERRRWLVVGLILLLLPGVLTWLMDSFNSRDIGNKNFTTYVNRNDAVVFRWMREHLPKKSTVLNYSLDYENFRYDDIPPLAERSVYLGNTIYSRIFQVSQQEIQDRAKFVSILFEAESPTRFREIVQTAGIEYIFVGSDDPTRFPDAAKKLVKPHFFLLVREGDSGVFAVNPKQRRLKVFIKRPR